MRRLLVSVLFLFLLTSCRLPSLLPQVMGNGGDAPAVGTVHAPNVLKVRIGESLTLQAKPEEIANGATIALVDSETGATLGTSITSPTGEFVLTFGENVSLVDGRAYYLDVIKGLRLDTTKPLPPPNDPANPFNQAGADALRLRNLLFYQAATAAGPAGWKSLYDATPSNTVNVGNKSTALAVALALKQLAGETITLSDYAGVLKVVEVVGGVELTVIEKDPTWVLGGMDHNGFITARDVVKNAIESDRDPLQYTAYDQTTKTFRSSWVGFSMRTISPTVGPINQIITITGSGFEAGVPKVAINGREITVISHSAAEIKARVTPGTRSGPVSVQIGSILLAGNTFTVAFQDGHQAVLDRVVGGKTVRMLYVANPAWNTVVEIAPDGSVKKLWDGTAVPELSNPQQIAIWNKKLYVSCNPVGTANDLILELDPESLGYKRVHSRAVPEPFGLAFDTAGALHVSSFQDAGAVYKLRADGTELTRYAGVQYPRGIAFDYQGSIFVAEEQRGQIVKLTSPGFGATVWGLVPSPLGLAVDSAGDVFVASNVNDAIFRISSTRAMSVFAMLNKPGGLTFDDRGYMYVSDTEKNLVNRISPSGDARVYAYGISNPRGLAVDPANGTLYVSLSQSNAILKVEGGILKPFVTGIANPMTISFRGKGLIISHPETHTVSFAETTGKLSTLATGLVYPGGADQAVDGAGNLTGKLYVGRFGDMESPITARYPYDSYTISDGNYNGVDVVENKVPTLRRWLYRMKLSYIAVDASKNIFAIQSSDRTLTKISVAPGGGNSSRRIQRLCGPGSAYSFPSDPGWVSLDRDGNVYVVVPGDNAVYRFKPSGDTYVMSKITNFNQPWGIAFSDTIPQAMFVSNTGDGLIRKVTTPATDAAALSTTTFNIPADTTVKGLTYMSTGTAGTGTLYMANGTSVMKASLSGNNYVAASYGPYFTDLPVAWSYLYAKSDTKELYGWGNSVFSHRLVPGTPPVPYTYRDYTGWGRYLGFTFAPDFTYYAMEMHYGGVSTMWSQNTTREILLNGNTLYVASPDSMGSGGVLRIDLATNEELLVPIQSYSLALYGTSLYVGATNNRIYEVDAAGRHYERWNIGTLPYGLDIRGNTVWAVGADSVIYERVIGGGIADHRFGMMGPVF